MNVDIKNLKVCQHCISVIHSTFRNSVGIWSSSEWLPNKTCTPTYLPP